LDARSFRAFIAVAELGSFSQAAEKLHLTQPAVSKRIAGLETDFGSRLLDRVGRRVQLTEAGRELLPRARRLLEELGDMRRALDSLGERVGGELAMGTSHHVGLHRLPPVLKEFSRRFPGVRLDIQFLDSESACRGVEQGSLELAVVTLPPGPLPPLHIEPLWRDPLCVVVGLDHPLAAAAPRSLAELLECPAVLPAPATYTRDILERALRRRGLELTVGLTTNYLETLKMLAVTGLGWALLPATMVDGSLRTLDVPGLALARELGIVTHARRTLSNAARAMRAVCLEHAGAERGRAAPGAEGTA
jgi:DNA-binding transcriptional LysR family regulator